VCAGAKLFGTEVGGLNWEKGRVPKSGGGQRLKRVNEGVSEASSRRPPWVDDKLKGEPDGNGIKHQFAKKRMKQSGKEGVTRTGE